MSLSIKTDVPELFRHLAELGCLRQEELRETGDGFYAAVRSVADILARRDILSVPGTNGGTLECRLFFDDWYLYAVSRAGECACSLFKMREQEYDAKLGLKADGDAPGVTICFIGMDTAPLLRCLLEPTEENRRLLGGEIDRVVARSGQRHSGTLKDYFAETGARGPYLVAKLYTDHIASLAGRGELPVPERYAQDYRRKGLRGRVARFVEENNAEAGTAVCDHRVIRIADPACPTQWERLAILATHAGNVSFYSFAAEVQFHARFLTWWARIPIPVIGRSPYASAIRADMSIADAEFSGPTPYYRLNSRLVKRQYICHNKERV